MPATKMAVIYSIDQSRVRRIIYPDDDADLLNRPVDCLPGEAVEIMDQFTTDIDVLNQHISKITGQPTKDDRYHVLDEKGEIINTYLMDPTVDPIPDDIPVKGELASQDTLEVKVQELKTAYLQAQEAQAAASTETVTLQPGV